MSALLDDPARPYGEIFVSEPRYAADGRGRALHASVDGAVTRLQRSPYFEGQSDYWYASAGDPAGSLASGVAAWAPLPVLDAAAAPATGFGVQQTLYPARQLILPAGPLEGRGLRLRRIGRDAHRARAARAADRIGLHAR